MVPEEEGLTNTPQCCDSIRGWECSSVTAAGEPTHRAYGVQTALKRHISTAASSRYWPSLQQGNGERGQQPHNIGYVTHRATAG